LGTQSAATSMERSRHCSRVAGGVSTPPLGLGHGRVGRVGHSVNHWFSLQGRIPIANDRYTLTKPILTGHRPAGIRRQLVFGTLQVYGLSSGTAATKRMERDCERAW